MCRRKSCFGSSAGSTILACGSSQCGNQLVSHSSGNLCVTYVIDEEAFVYRRICRGWKCQYCGQSSTDVCLRKLIDKCHQVNAIAARDVIVIDGLDLFQFGEVAALVQLYVIDCEHFG